MLLRSVQHMGHSDALKKFYLTLIPIFNLFLQQFLSKKMILNCIGSKRFVLKSSPSSDRYSAQSHRWISVFHCRPEIEINRMTTIDKLLCFLVPLGMLHYFIFWGYFVILSFFETVFRKKKKKKDDLVAANRPLLIPEWFSPESLKFFPEQQNQDLPWLRE